MVYALAITTVARRVLLRCVVNPLQGMKSEVFTFVFIQYKASSVTLVKYGMEKTIHLLRGARKENCIIRVFQIPKWRGNMKDS